MRQVIWAVGLLLFSALGYSVGGCGGRTSLVNLEEDTSVTPLFAEESIARLESQSSFRFRHHFERKGGPLGVKGSFEGAYLFPDRKSIKGYLTMGDRTEKLDFVSSGDSEYYLDSESGKWMERPASDEACPVAQLEKVVGLGGFRYLRREKVGGISTSLFSFEPNLAFLDPTMEKELAGRIWVAEGSGLPVKVDVHSEDGSLSWDMVLLGFNSHTPISIPLKNAYEADFLVAPDEGEGLSSTASILSERLSLVGLESVRLKSKSNEKLVFSFESESGREDMVALISRPGSLSVRLAVWPDEPVSQLSDEKIKDRYGRDAELAYESGNVANALVLKEEVLANRDLIGASLTHDELSRPVVDIQYSSKMVGIVEAATARHVGKPIAFELDGEILRAPIVRRGISGNRLRIEGFTLITQAKAASIILSTEPLPLTVRLVSVREVSR